VKECASAEVKGRLKKKIFGMVMEDDLRRPRGQVAARLGPCVMFWIQSNLDGIKRSA
jgi:hypothetical protein